MPNIFLIPHEHADQEDIYELMSTADHFEPMFVKSGFTHNLTYLLRAIGHLTRRAKYAGEKNTAKKANLASRISYMSKSLLSSDYHTHFLRVNSLLFFIE